MNGHRHPATLRQTSRRLGNLGNSMSTRDEITTPGFNKDDTLPDAGTGFAARPAADKPTDSGGGGAVVSPRGYDTPLPPDLALRVAAAPVARHLASRLRAAGLSVSIAAAPEGDGGGMAHLLLVAGTPRLLEHAVRIGTLSPTLALALAIALP